MKDDLITLPAVHEIKEMLVVVRQEIDAEIKENPESSDSAELVYKVIETIEEKLGNQTSLDKLNLKEKIGFAAHLNFLHSILDDFFYVDDDMEFDDEEFEDLEESSIEEE